MLTGGTVGLVSSVGRAPDLKARDRGFESCIGHTLSALVYFTPNFRFGKCNLPLLES